MKNPQRSRAHLADERAELTGGEIVVETRKDGDADYDVAEETPDVVKGVDSDWREGAGTEVICQHRVDKRKTKIPTKSSPPTVKQELLVHEALLRLQQRLQPSVGPHVLHFTGSEKKTKQLASS